MQFTTSNIMQTLWEKSQDNLSHDEIKQFSNLTDHALMHADALAEVVQGIGGLVQQDDEVGSFHDKREVANLLWNISHQIDVLAGLLYVGTRAEDKLKEMD